MLNWKMIKILKMFLKNEILYLSDISVRLNIKKRSVIAYVDELNQYLNKNKLATIKFIGDSIFYELSKTLFNEIVQTSNYAYSPQERQAYLLYKILESNKIDYNQYEKHFQTSKSLYEKDIFAVKTFLKKENLDVEFLADNSIKVKIDLFKQRQLIIKIINENIDTMIKDILFKKDKSIQKVINLINEELDFHFTEKYLEFLNCFLHFWKFNYSKAHWFEIDEIDALYIKQTNEYLFAQQILKKNFKIENKDEIIYLAILLICGNINFEIDKKTDLFKKIDFVIMEFIFEVERQTLLIFSNKNKLVNEVINHFAQSYFRLKFAIQLNWDFYPIIEDKYKFYFKNLKNCIGVVENQLKIEFNTRELTLFLVYFILNLNKDTKSEKYKAAIILDSGMSVAMILKNEIEGLFDNVSITNIDKYQKIIDEHNDYDLLFATSKIDDQRVITINKIINKSDIEKIKNCLINLKTKQANKKYELIDILKIENINIIQEKLDWQTAIKYSANSLVKNNAIDQRYIDSMINNIKNYGPYIVLKKGLAIPHSSLKIGVQKIGVALTIFKQSILFDTNDETKSAHILITFCSPDNQGHVEALIKLVELVKNESVMQKILEINDVQKIYDLIFENN